MKKEKSDFEKAVDGWFFIMFLAAAIYVLVNVNFNFTGNAVGVNAVVGSAIAPVFFILIVVFAYFKIRNEIRK